MKAALVTVSLASAALLAACAVEKPLNTQALEQARAEVQALSLSPDASEIASRELATSRTSLSQAEEALKGKRQDDLDYYAYLATRQAKTGEARIAEHQARRGLAQLKR